jgi:hypothetical protein
MMHLFVFRLIARSAIRLISVHDIPLAVSARSEHGWHRPKGFYIRHQNDPPFSRMSDFGNMRLLETSVGYGQI